MLKIIEKDKDNNRELICNYLRSKTEFYTNLFSYSLTSGGTFETLDRSEEKVLFTKDYICHLGSGMWSAGFDSLSNLLEIKCEFSRTIEDDLEYELICKMNAILLPNRISICVNEADRIVVRCWFDTSLKYYLQDFGEECDKNIQNDCLLYEVNHFIEKTIGRTGSGLFPSLLLFIDTYVGEEGVDYEELTDRIYEEFCEFFN